LVRLLTEKLIEPTLDQVLEFCSRDPIERVFLEDVARRGFGRFLAVENDDRALVSLCHLGANLVPSGYGCGVFGDSASGTASKMIIGDERAVGELWREARLHMPEPRADRPGQPVYAIADPPGPGDSALRAATFDDLELLIPVCAAAHEFELGVDPIARDPEGFRWRTRAQIADARSWLWLDGGVILFKAEASAWTPTAVQIQQVWVDPSVRGRGYGARGMRDLCRLLLDTTPFVTLFVRTENAAAIALYESIGMRLVGRYRSLLF
jgi:RimJ/RimL family protein N-acetyltransferase